MKKILLSLMLAGSLFANEIQIFTTNSMNMKFDKETQLNKVYFGTIGQNGIQIYNSTNHSKTLRNGAMAGGLSVASVAAGRGSFSNIDSNGGLIGLAVVATITAGVIAFDMIENSSASSTNSGIAIIDNQYILKNIATNKNGKQTVLQTIIVSHDKLNLEEAESMALNNQIKLLKDN